MTPSGSREIASAIARRTRGGSVMSWIRGSNPRRTPTKSEIACHVRQLRGGTAGRRDLVFLDRRQARLPCEGIPHETGDSRCCGFPTPCRTPGHDDWRSSPLTGRDQGFRCYEHAAGASRHDALSRPRPVALGAVRQSPAGRSGRIRVVGSMRWMMTALKSSAGWRPAGAVAAEWATAVEGAARMLSRALPPDQTSPSG